MTAPLLRDLFFGYTDGKHEFNEVSEDIFERGFYQPSHLDINKLVDGTKFLVTGARGSGKTTLLRWLSHNVRHTHVTAFLLFKSEVSETKKQDFSRALGIKELVLDGLDKGIIQDFRDLWTIIYITRICTAIMENTHCVTDLKPVVTILRIAGISTEKPMLDDLIPKILKLVRIKWQDVNYGTEWEAGLWGDAPDGRELVTPSVIASTIRRIFRNIDFKSPIFLFVDELEIFYRSDDQYKRDCDLLRDSIFSAEELRSEFRKSGSGCRILISVRDEVIKAVGARGEEVYKIVDDYSSNINWSERRASKDHALIKLVEKKMISTLAPSVAPDLGAIFPPHIASRPYFQYLTDNSQCKPRNLFTCLRIIQEKFPAHSRFEQYMFDETEVEYSARVWKEIEYLLGATFPEDAVSGTRRLLFAMHSRTNLIEIQKKLTELERNYPKEYNSIRAHGLINILERLFDYGVLGNVYYDRAAAKTIYMWSFRGEPVFQPDRDIEFQHSVRKHLSIIQAIRK